MALSDVERFALVSLYIYFRSTPVSCSDSELLKNVQILMDRCNEVRFFFNEESGLLRLSDNFL
jgi:hypothetical protein